MQGFEQMMASLLSGDGGGRGSLQSVRQKRKDLMSGGFGPTEAPVALETYDDGIPAEVGGLANKALLRTGPDGDQGERVPATADPRYVGDISAATVAAKDDSKTAPAAAKEYVIGYERDPRYMELTAQEDAIINGMGKGGLRGYSDKWTGGHYTNQQTMRLNAIRQRKAEIRREKYQQYALRQADIKSFADDFGKIPKLMAEAQAAADAAKRAELEGRHTEAQTLKLEAEAAKIRSEAANLEALRGITDVADGAQLLRVAGDAASLLHTNVKDFDPRDRATSSVGGGGGGGGVMPAEQYKTYSKIVSDLTNAREGTNADLRVLVSLGVTLEEVKTMSDDEIRAKALKLSTPPSQPKSQGMPSVAPGFMGDPTKFQYVPDGPTVMRRGAGPSAAPAYTGQSGATPGPSSTPTPNGPTRVRVRFDKQGNVIK